MSHINYAFNPEDDALPRDKMKLRNIASTKYSGDWPSIPHSHSYAELFYIVDGEGQFQINDKLFPVQAHQLVVVNPNVSTPKSALNHTRWNILCLASKGWNLRFPMPPRAAFAFIPLKRITMCWSVCARSCGKCRTESRVSRYFARPTWILSLYS